MITPCWLKAVWGFLSKNRRVQLKREKEMDEFTPALRRVNDGHLVTLFVDAGYEGKSTDCLNRVRKHKEVSTLVDLTTGNGTPSDFCL